MNEALKLETDVVVAGAGAAGMYAAVAAARNGARVVVIDKNVIGRGGGTIMAQMTCAAALGETEPDGSALHTEDTIEAGRGLCDENLAALLCDDAPDRIRELKGWKVDWATDERGRINQVTAPGHGRKRCCYVDFLCTGAAISAALRNRISRTEAIRRLSNVGLTEIVVDDGRVRGPGGTIRMPVILYFPINNLRSLGRSFQQVFPAIMIRMAFQKSNHDLAYRFE